MQIGKRWVRIGFLTAAILIALGQTADAIVIDWVTVGAPGNAPEAFTGFGSVATTYRISKTEITNAQYARFLNDVAMSDPNALYNIEMSNNFTGGIVRSGFVGNWTYSPVVGRENMPVDFVTFYSALRFANWLHNGQPVGPQDTGTTEDGAYQITPTGIANNSIVRRPSAAVFLPSEDEWFKAAFYDAASASYFDTATGTSLDPVTACALPDSAPNTANCRQVVGNLTDVGSYTGSPSPNGTFDQAGNVNEWNEKIFAFNFRGLRGGAWGGSPASPFSPNVKDRPSNAGFNGIRVASIFVPEPNTPLLQVTALLALAVVKRRRRTVPACLPPSLPAGI